jgi:hypothetical protein
VLHVSMMRPISLARLVAISDFSGLMSSACASATDAAIAPMVGEPPRQRKDIRASMIFRPMRSLFTGWHCRLALCFRLFPASKTSLP